MKQLTEARSAKAYARALLRTAYSLRPSRAAALYFFASLLLCPLSFGYGAVPAAICMLCACRQEDLAATALGLLVGYGLFWGLAASFPLYALAAIVLCARCLLPKHTKGRVFFAIYLSATALLGAIFVIGAYFSVPSMRQWGIRLLTAAGGTPLFQAAIRRNTLPACVICGCLLLLGVYAIPLPLQCNLALPVLGWLAGAAGGLVYVCAGCAALALVHPQAMPYAAVFCLAALVRRLLDKKAPPLRLLAACAVYALAGLRLQSYSFSACAAVGAAIALFYAPEQQLPAQRPKELPAHPAQQELNYAAQALSQAAAMLGASGMNPKRELAELFDSASAQVCQSCARHERCWQDNSQATYDDLTASGAAILEHGCAALSDFPERFRTQCIHPEAFLTAVNDALETARAGRRLRRRMDEARAVAKAQYEILATFLRHLAQQLYVPDARQNYCPELAVQAAGRRGSSISGDRGAAFAGPNGTYYVLLCDGMGTGSEAAHESTQAIDLLRQLLHAGLDAERALKALNGIYILRDNGCFSTVDLLRVNLTSGDAILYKWGAAPSYLKRHHGLRHLGGVSLPPGVAQSEEMEQIHFSLEHGCVIVLLSDGLGGRESQRRLECCDSLYPQDITASLFVGREAADDDCTAVALRLRPTA